MNQSFANLPKTVFNTCLWVWKLLLSEKLGGHPSHPPAGGSPPCTSQWKPDLGLLTIMAALLVIVAGCKPVPTSTTVPRLTTAPVVGAFPLTVTDDEGREVTFERAPERIVSLAPSHTETLFALGLDDEVVGVTEYCNYPPEALEKPKIGGFSKIDLEKVVGLNPDLILATSIHSELVVPALVERGLKVIVVNPEDIDAVLTRISLVGQVTGRAEAARELVADLEERIAAVEARVKGLAIRPRVFWELSPDLYTVGPGSFIDDIITRAGGANVASEAQSQWPQLSLEALVLADPEIIILGDHPYGATAGEVKSRPGWADITAVKRGRIVEVEDDDLVSQPGPRIAEALEFVVQAIHPEGFE